MEQNAQYWNNKLSAFFHDPFDKALSIPGHESRATKYFEALGLQVPAENYWKSADVAAAGFERGVLPVYDADSHKSGAINFINEGILTHPISSEGKFAVNVSISPSVQDEIVALLRSDIEKIASGDEVTRAYNRFLYAFFLLRYRLAAKNIAGLGALWHRLPADTRIPDHSIWQHNALVSALYSCMEAEKSEQGIALAVVSITPVQSFIAKARKLRDYWTGSVVLSWLAFEGIVHVMEHLGPDHLLYPSLVDQPLVEQYLRSKRVFDELINDSCLPKPLEIATFPNKFLFLVPQSLVSPICEAIKKRIIQKWNALCTEVRNSLFQRCVRDDSQKTALEAQFKRQTELFWNIDYAAARLVGEHDIKALGTYFEEEVFESHAKLAKLFQSAMPTHAMGCLYTVSHRLVQSTLAYAKSQRKISRLPENGEKCHLCGEFEVLHGIAQPEKLSASKYVQTIQNFWNNIYDAYGEYDFNEGEKLCAVCMAKRLAPIVLKGKDHILSGIFKDAESFPSTTEMALHGYFERCAITDKNARWTIAQKLHQKDEFEKEIRVKFHKKLRDEDKYYAILLMDGDNMGSLINGESVAARWEDVLHPALCNKIVSKSVDTHYVQMWSEIFTTPELSKRMLSPALHAAISEALGDFSLYSVKSIIEKYGGRLIYAGGDDVCAVLPSVKALSAAREIQQSYNQPFVMIDETGMPTNLPQTFSGNKGKLAIHLGKGAQISISAAILICHHKESLSEMIARAHTLLEKTAKEECGRNACAIELRRRAGGSRYFAAKWDDPVWQSFQNLTELLRNRSAKERLSTSLVYRLEEMREGILPLIEADKSENYPLYRKFVQKLLTKSLFSEKSPQLEQTAAEIVHLTYHNNKFSNEGLIIATFLAGGEQ